MARIRSIKPEFWVSEQIAECSTNARLTFVGMWNFCDDNGVHPAKPKTLKAELFPMDDITAAAVGDWVSELVRAGLVAEFESEGERYWHVTGWTRHQKIDRPSFKHPTPPAPNSSSPRRTLDESSASPRRAPPPGEDRSGVDRSGEEKAASPKARPAAPVATRGTRLPKDWVLTDDLRQYCVDTRPNLDPDEIAEGFRDYWISKAGKDALKVDWIATWRRWVREQRQRAGGVAHQSRPTALHADDMIGIES